jgi:anti-anti-sigma factor
MSPTPDLPTRDRYEPDSSSLLRITVNHPGARPVLVVAGELDATNAADLHAAIEHAHHDSPTVIVDLARLTFCDHAGLEVLLTQHATLRADQGELILRNPSRVVTRLLHLSPPERRLTIQPAERDRK